MQQMLVLRLKMYWYLYQDNQFECMEMHSHSMVDMVVILVEEVGLEATVALKHMDKSSRNLY